MSLFANSIGSKTNFVRTDEVNDITAETTFEGQVIFTNGVSGLDVSDITGINQYALQTALDDEINNRTNADTDLQTNIDLKADQTDLNTEIQDRTNADTNLQTQINLKLAEANSIHRDNYAFYCVDGRNDLHSVLPNVNNQGAYISISSGSFGNLTPLTIDKDNMSMFSVPSTPPICEFACPLTISSTANRIRTRYMSFDGVCNLNGKRCVYSHSTFNEDVNIGQGTTEYMTIANCEFSAGKTITFSQFMGSVVYIIECNIAGANLVFNQSSPLQVIFSNCSGFVSLPTSSQATLVGLNVLASGAVVQHNISKIVLPTGEGNNNQVLTSTGSGNCIWTTPSGGGGGSGGIMLESINEVLRGQTIITKNGDQIVLPNITAVVQPNQTGGYSILAAINGYIPPTGTKSVLLSLKFFIGWSGTNGSCNALFNCRIDGGGPTTIVKTSDSFIKSDRGMGEIGQYSIDCLINIDASYTNSIPEGKFSSWTTGKLFNFCCSRTITNGIPYIFSNNPHPYNTALLKFVEPIIIIQAFS